MVSTLLALTCVSQKKTPVLFFRVSLDVSDKFKAACAELKMPLNTVGELLVEKFIDADFSGRLKAIGHHHDDGILSDNEIKSLEGARTPYELKQIFNRIEERLLPNDISTSHSDKRPDVGNLHRPANPSVKASSKSVRGK